MKKEVSFAGICSVFLSVWLKYVSTLKALICQKLEKNKIELFKMQKMVQAEKGMLV